MFHSSSNDFPSSFEQNPKSFGGPKALDDPIWPWAITPPVTLDLVIPLIGTALFAVGNVFVYCCGLLLHFIHLSIEKLLQKGLL